MGFHCSEQVGILDGERPSALQITWFIPHRSPPTDGEYATLASPSASFLQLSCTVGAHLVGTSGNLSCGIWGVWSDFGVLSAMGRSLRRRTAR